ncbi:uncharacterized protein [Fopius arisanus]|nr:PREDICTED: uncharacterized protein LOC105272334 isoform X2 [Fopius arisanus]XP_011312731.1 PREDICTED: uncharacterized protein LOC105272334 isoform X2 [Fopius arisanus]XP_011312732.1 PREDICTED: uncharacterized protein LOC105272334 isoform X2 [Fopius arisanus]XP_011312733.1 PREDICTED: uncharacterized protein LOC105272334 isoform X2 [Fopius arisanus]
MPKALSAQSESGTQIEWKKRSSVLTENKNNWPGTFREQTKASLKQSLHHVNKRMSTSKTNRTLTADYREPRKSKNNFSSANPSVSSIESGDSTESVIVTDKGVQCGTLFHSSNNHFNLLNPIPTIGFLMKELESLIKDKKSSGILYEMEQALLRIPNDSGKSGHADVETILKHTHASATMLAATGKEMQTTLEVTLKQQVILQQQLEEKSLQLEASLSREADLKALVIDLRQRLTESSKLDLMNKKLLNDLKEKNEENQLLQNIITQLKTELNEETELARQRCLDCQFFEMEKEKLSVISSLKDSQLIEHRKSMKNLQNLIGDQLLNIKKFLKPENVTVNQPRNLSLMVSGGRASSSPVRTVNNSIISLNNNRHNDVDVLESSISTIDGTHPHTSINRKMSVQLETLMNESENECQTEKFTEKTHLELTSFRADEGSQSDSISKPNEDEFIYDLRNGIRDSNYDEMDPQVREVQMSRGRVSLDERIEASKGLKEIEMMYENTRINSKIEVRVPSPPRNYPHPDWSDSSLPTMSISSNLL